MTLPRQRIAILGGGPGGYEAALVAAQLGADVTLVDSDGLGGACVLTSARRCLSRRHPETCSW